jgi:hypothetical protein
MSVAAARKFPVRDIFAQKRAHCRQVAGVP